MGTDIHAIVEIKRGNIGWEVYRGTFMCYWCDGAGKTTDGNKCFTSRCHDGRSAEPWQERMYDVFGMLAGVRNGVGFAGLDMGDGWPVIRAGKDNGLPRDLNPTTRQRGVVDMARYAEWKKNTDRPPTQWSGDIRGHSVVHLSNKEADTWLAAHGTPAMPAQAWDHDQTHRYTRIEWTRTARDAAGSFYSKFIPELLAIAKAEGVPLDHVRYTFGFDS